MNPTIPKAELLERENRWSRPAGIVSLLAAVLFVASVLIQAPAGGTETDAEKLTKIHEHSSSLLLGATVQSVGLLLFLVPLLFLFGAARGRASVVRRPIAVVAVVGFVLLAASGVLNAVGLISASDTFDKELPSLERQDRAAEAKKNADTEETGSSAKSGTSAAAAKATSRSESTESTEPTESSSSEASSTATDESSDDSEEDPPSEARANDLITESSTVKLGAYMGLAGVLGLISGMVYIPLWSMRTGLLTRFWGTLGMALGVSLVFFGPFLLILWFAVIGLLLIGVWPRGLPPAWAAGEAVPWLRPGEPTQSPGGTVEGSGREISEPPLPEEPPPDAPAHPGSPYQGETPGQRRKKRKRRS